MRCVQDQDRQGDPKLRTPYAGHILLATGRHPGRIEKKILDIVCDQYNVFFVCDKSCCPRTLVTRLVQSLHTVLRLSHADIRDSTSSSSTASTVILPAARSAPVPRAFPPRAGNKMLLVSTGSISSAGGCRRDDAISFCPSASPSTSLLPGNTITSSASPYLRRTY
jgi:hypothetical protein